MNELCLWLHRGLLALPLVVWALSWPRRLRARLRALVLGAVTLCSATAGALLLAGWGAKLPVVSLRGPAWLGGLRVDGLTLPLFFMVTAIWAAGLVIAPAQSYSPARVRRSALSCACLLVALSTESPLLLALCWTASNALFLFEHRHLPRVARVAGVYLGLSTLCFVAGAALLWTGREAVVAAALLSAAVLVRKGIVPLHSWMPESFEHGYLVPTILFSTPQLGTYVTVVVLLPRAPASLLTVVATASLLTAAYAALLGLRESDARRAVGYLFMSQSALVLAGIDSATQEGVGGSLAVWLSSALASAGLGLVVASLESRRGRLALDRHHGGAERMPLMAASFVVLGLATVGFPATLGFLGQELLLLGSVERFPYLGFVLVAATAVNGITVLRMYFSLFCGQRLAPVPLALRRRELTVFAALAALLLGAGLFPRRLAESRTTAAAELLATRARLVGR